MELLLDYTISQHNRRRLSGRGNIVGPLPLELNTPSIPGATVGASYNVPLDPDGGTAPYFWAISAGALPPGIVLSAAGVLLGQATTAGSYNFTVRLTDSMGVSITKAYPLAVSAPPTATDAPRAILIDLKVMDATFAKTSTAPTDTDVWGRGRKKTIDYAKNTSMPASQNVAAKTSPPEGGTINDYVSGGPYWWPRIKNKKNATTGKWEFDEARVGGTYEEERQDSGGWQGTHWLYFGITEVQYDAQMKLSEEDRTLTKVDYSRVGDYPRTLAHEDNDPSKPQNGLPYVARDAQKNEALTKTMPEQAWMKNTHRDLRRTALGYYYSKKPGQPRDETLAIKVANTLKVWYITPKTRMNPNMNWAQYIPGHWNGQGRSIGSVDAEYLPRALDAALLIKDSPNWTATDMANLRIWVKQYSDWMMGSSRVATATRILTNNIRAQFEMQYIACMLFLGEHTKAYYRMKNVIVPHFNVQASPTGYFYREYYDRPDAWGYSTKVLKMWFELAEANEHIIVPAGEKAIDLWNHVSASGATLRKCFNFHYAAAKRGGAFGDPNGKTTTTNLNKLHYDSVVRWASAIWVDPPKPDGTNTDSEKWWFDWLSKEERHTRWLLGSEDDYSIRDGAEFLVIPYRYRFEAPPELKTAN